MSNYFSVVEIFLNKCLLLWGTLEQLTRFKEGRPPTPVVDETKRKIHRLSGISKKQFSDFSRHSTVKENWRTTGQSTAFHAGMRCWSLKKVFPLLFILNQWITTVGDLEVLMIYIKKKRKIGENREKFLILLITPSEYNQVLILIKRRKTNIWFWLH